MASPKERGSERIERIGSAERKSSFFDLSKTGVCCLTEKKYNQDSSVLVRLNDLTLSAKVVYCRKRTDGFRVGLQFIHDSSEALEVVRDAVDQ